jgi:hypothetical protein
MDGEIRAIHPAKITSIAFFGVYCMWGMIPLGVKSGGKSQYLAGTELNAKTARLASFHYN